MESTALISTVVGYLEVRIDPDGVGMRGWLVAGLTRPALTCVFALVSCRVTIHGPLDIEHPVPVYLAHYDRFHTSLVIPEAGIATEFTYGDLDLFARYDQSFWPAFKGMSFPTQGVLGRRTVAWVGRDIESLRSALDNVESCNRVSVLYVESSSLEALAFDLQRCFEAESGSAMHNEHLGLTFVKHPRSYTFFHNCNHQLAEWLERMGCRVSWVRALADFEVVSAAPSSGGGGDEHE